MTDQYKKTGDDEYQFPQDEYLSGEKVHENDADANDVADEDHMDTSKSKLSSILERLPMLKNKRVVGIIIVAVVALIGFKIISPGHKVKVVKKATPTMSAEQQQQDMLMSKYNRLSQNASKSQQTMGQLQSQVSNLQSALDTSVRSNEAMKNAVVALAQQVKNLSQEVKSDAKSKKHGKHPVGPVITYNLVALESGRAWIMGSNGISNSVTVGTKIKNYGVVKAIETNSGRVLMSSGKVITYNADGN